MTKTQTAGSCFVSIEKHRMVPELNMRLHDLLTCQQFELIGTVLHVATKEQEERMEDDRLRKLRPLVNTVKSKCQEYYQLLQHYWWMSGW